MISALVPLILEAALRALLAAAVIWTGLRLLRIGNVLTQKAAWELVLIAALAMPLLPGWPGFHAWAALRLPTMSNGDMPAASPVSIPVSAPVSTAPSATGTRRAFTAEPSDSLRRDSAIPQSDSAVPDHDSAPSISNPQYDVPASAVPQVRSAPEPAPSISEPVATLPSAPVRASAAGMRSVETGRTTTGIGRATAGSSGTGTNRTSTTSASATGVKPTPIRLLMLALLVYLGVAAALVLRLLIGLGSALRLWITAEPVSQLPLALAQSDRRNTMRLRSSVRVASPVNIGSGIVLPADYAAWDQQKLRIVVAHERSHIRQGDFYLQLLAGLYASLFWFSPLGWWLKRKLCELGEAISDRAGLEVAASRSSYAQLLLEFAALPRPTLTGVAMARTSHLSQRIERLLNESTFRRAFAAGGRRALLAVLLVPAAIFAATTLVRVQAATPAGQTQTAAQSATEGQSTPEQVSDQATVPAPMPEPPSAPAPVAAPFPPPPPPEQAGQPGPPPPPVAPGAPQPPFNSGASAMPPMPPMPPMPAVGAMVPVPPMPRGEYGFGFPQEGDPYAIAEPDGSIITPGGMRGHAFGANHEDIERARKSAHGAFLWFQHDGKSYIVEDPAVVAQVEAMNKAMEDVQKQMRDLGKQMKEFGEQQRDLGKQMRDVNIPTPDLTKEIADLNAAAAALKATQGATITQKDLMDLQREIGRIQGELGGLQGKIGAQQGNIGGEMGKFGAQQGKLGGQMGKLGAQMGQIIRENQTKINGIITDSISNGKAKPVE